MRLDRAVGPAPPTPVAGPRSTRTRTLLLVVLVAALFAVVVVAVPQPTPPPQLLLGRMDLASGVAATQPPPADLHVAWEVPRLRVPGEYDEGFQTRPLAAAGDRLRLGSRVVDVVTGETVRWPARGPEEGRVAIENGHVVVIHSVTGTVVSRTPLPAAWVQRELWVAHHADGVTLLSSGGSSLLLGADGAAVAELDGQVLEPDRIDGDAAVFPLRHRDTSTYGSRDFTLPVTLVRAADGEVLLDLPGGPNRIVDVVGSLALVVATDVGPDWMGNVPRPATWSALLLDAQTGRRLQRWDVTARAAPRLLGRLGDGTAIVAIETQDAVELLAVPRDGPRRTVATTARPRGSDRTVLDVAAVVEDVLVVLDEDRLVGRAPDGEPLWAVAAEGALSVQTAGGYVVSRPYALSMGDSTTVVRRAGDGDRVATVGVTGFVRDTVTAGGRVGMFPSGVVDGWLATTVSPESDVLGSRSWVNLRTGRTASADVVLAPHLPAELDVRWAWSFNGTVVGAADAQVPVLSRLGGGGLEVLEPGRGFVGVDLMPGVGPGGEMEREPTVVGATAERLVVATWGATYLVERATGTVQPVAGSRAMLLAGGVVLAMEPGDRGGCCRCGAECLLGSVVALDLETGARLWAMPAWPSHTWDSTDGFAADDDLVLVHGLADITARAVEDGAVRWTHTSTVELFDEVVLGPHGVVAASTDGHVLALDRADGSVLWRSTVGAPVASLSGAGDHVLVGTYDGFVVHLDEDGREVQRVRVSMAPVTVLEALGDTVVAAGDDGLVGLRSAATGLAPRDRVELP